MCGRPKSNIAHHKIRFRDCYDNENIAHDVNNGICLCKRCHKMVHGGGNYING
ncbi:HNH endonuclease [Blautia sp. BCRC 81119]|uniref:HNH endonuclease n=1 Tax=Blautia sp. BCRC 81119 TaxID=2212480 RepID=UPI003FA451BB